MHDNIVFLNDTESKRRGPKRKPPDEVRAGNISVRVLPETKAILERASGSSGIGKLLDDVARILKNLGEAGESEAEDFRSDC